MRIKIKNAKLEWQHNGKPGADRIYTATGPARERLEIRRQRYQASGWWYDAYVNDIRVPLSFGCRLYHCVMNVESAVKA